MPLARLFSTKYETLGFDVNRKRVSELMNGVDSTLEVTDELLKEAIDLNGFRCTFDPDEVVEFRKNAAGSLFIIVSVSTAIEERDLADLTTFIPV